MQRCLDLWREMRVDVLLRLGLYGSWNHLDRRVAMMNCESMPIRVPSGLMLRSNNLVLIHPPAIGALKLKETALTSLTKDKTHTRMH